MALIQCPECGKQVSDKAKVCVFCGYPLMDDQSHETLLSNPPSSNMISTKRFRYAVLLIITSIVVIGIILIVGLKLLPDKLPAFSPFVSPSITSPSYTESPQAQVPNEIISQIDAICVSNIGEAYKGYALDMSETSNILILKVCIEGSAAEFYANSADWQDFTKAITELSESCKQRFTESGFANWGVAIWALNDTNPERVLFQAVNGIPVA